MTTDTMRAVRTFLFQRFGIWIVGGTLWGVSLILTAILSASKDPKLNPADHAKGKPSRVVDFFSTLFS